MVQVVEIFLDEDKETIDPPQLLPWVVMSWWHSNHDHITLEYSSFNNREFTYPIP